MEARYGEDAEAMLSQPATKIFLRTTEPKAAKWVSEAIGEIEIERIRETHFDGSRTGRNYALDRQTEPLVMPSEISGLDDLRGFLKYGNHVARFSFPSCACARRAPVLMSERWMTSSCRVFRRARTPKRFRAISSFQNRPHNRPSTRWSSPHVDHF